MKISIAILSNTLGHITAQVYGPGIRAGQHLRELPTQLQDEVENIIIEWALRNGMPPQGSRRGFTLDVLGGGLYCPKPRHWIGEKPERVVELIPGTKVPERFDRNGVGYDDVADCSGHRVSLRSTVAVQSTTGYFDSWMLTNIRCVDAFAKVDPLLTVQQPFDPIGDALSHDVPDARDYLRRCGYLNLNIESEPLSLVTTQLY